MVLQQAALLLQPGWELSQNPMMPVLTAGVHSVSGLSLIDSGLLLTSLFCLLLCVGFVDTARLLGADKTTASIAAMLILTLPLVNGARADIAAEVGYWAFSLLALKHLINYNRKLNTGTVVSCLCYSAIASLFGAEGLLVMALSPFILLFTLPRRQRTAGVLRLLIPTLILLAALIFSGVSVDVSGYLGQGEPFVGLTQTWANFVSTTAGSLVGSADANSVALGVVLTLSLLAVIRGLGITLLAILLWGHGRKWITQVPAQARVIIMLYLLLCMVCLVAAGILGAAADSRLGGLAVILLLLLLPFILDTAWSRVKPPWLGRGLVITVLVFQAFTSFSQHRQATSYIAEAANWLEQHGEGDSSLISNVEYLVWTNRLRGGDSRASRHSLQEIFAAGAWRERRYLAALEEVPGDPRDWAPYAAAGDLQLQALFTSRDRSYLIAIFENTGQSPTSPVTPPQQ